MSWSSDDSVVSVIAAAGPAFSTASVGRSREAAREPERKPTTPNKPKQPAKSPTATPAQSLKHDQQKSNKTAAEASADTTPTSRDTKPAPKTTIPTQADQPNRKLQETITETKTEDANPNVPARALRRRNRSRSTGKQDQAVVKPIDSSQQKTDPSSSEKLSRVEEQNIGLVPSDSTSVGSTEASRQIGNDNTLNIKTGENTMGNRLSSEKNKVGKDQDSKKKGKEAKKNAKAWKSKSPASDRESAVENRSSIETTDSYSSAATLVATANAAVGRRSPKKSPRSIPRTGVKLREAFSSDDESLTSAGFRTPLATTPLMKRATEQTSPSQKLLEFGKNIEREIGKFARRSPTTQEKQNNGTDKLLNVHHKRTSRDGAVETDSDSFAMFENTEQLYTAAPKDFLPIDDNLSDDVFMSCIDLAANSPDIPSRSQSKNIANQASPALAKKFPASTEVKDTEPKQKMTLLQIATQGTIHPSKQSGVLDSTRRTQTLPTKSPDKSPSSSKRFHSESPKTAPSKIVAPANDGNPNKSEEKVKLKHSPVIPRKFVVGDPKTQKTTKSPTPPKSAQTKPNTTTNQKSPTTQRQIKKGSKSPTPQKSRESTKPSSPNPAQPRRYPAENYSPKIQKRIQAAPGSPVIPPHKPKEGSKSPAAIRQIKARTPVSSPSQKRKVEAPFPVKPSVVVVAQTKDPEKSIPHHCSKAEEESSQIQDSPKASKQDKMLLDVTKKKEHLRSTYDNVPDSDDSMAYFTDKNDPIFFEDNCVSEEIVATEKTPLHYKVEEPKKLGIAIMQAPTKATIKCVQQGRGPTTHVVDAKPTTTTQTTAVATSISTSESKTIGGIVKELVIASKINTTSATTITEKAVTPMVAVESQLHKKSEQSSKLQAKTSEPPVQNSKPVDICRSPEPVAVSVESKQSNKESEPSVQKSGETEQLTKRQIRRRNKKKQLQMGDKGSVDSSDAPLSPPLPSGDTFKDVIHSEKTKDCQEEAIETQTLATSVSKDKCNDPDKQKGVTVCDPINSSVKQDIIKRDHVPPPSPSANDGLGGIVEEDEDRDDVENIFVDDKAREVLVFGESVLKRLSSLVESQGDSSELERRFQRDFEDTDDVNSELNDSKKSCLEVLDEICDMGEKFKKEHEVAPEAPPVRNVSDIKQEGGTKCDSDGKLSVHSSPSVQKRPSIPNELQLNTMENKVSVVSPVDPSVTQPKRDSQKLTEVIDSYGEDITPSAVPKVDIFCRSNDSYIIPNQTNIVIQDGIKSRSSDEEFLSAERRFSSEALQVPAIEETFSELMSVKNILQEMEEKTPTSEPLPRFIGPCDLASPPSYLTGSGRRSRMSPAITERTESELDISEQLDNVSISTDSMYADDEDDGSEMIINKTYTEETGGECQVSYTFYNTAQGYDSDEFWANSSAAEENYQMLEESANQASCTFKKARTEMHEIQRHLQDLRRQMDYLQDDVQGTTLSPSMSLGSSEWRPLSE